MTLILENFKDKIIRFNKAIHVKRLTNTGMVVEFDFDYNGENQFFEAFVQLEGIYQLYDSQPLIKI